MNQILSLLMTKTWRCPARVQRIPRGFSIACLWTPSNLSSRASKASAAISPAPRPDLRGSANCGRKTSEVLITQDPADSADLGDIPAVSAGFSEVSTPHGFPPAFSGSSGVSAPGVCKPPAPSPMVLTQKEADPGRVCLPSPVERLLNPGSSPGTIYSKGISGTSNSPSRIAWRVSSIFSLTPSGIKSALS